MDGTTADKLISLTNRFYETQASSFSATRQSPWPGWERVAKRLAEAGIGGQSDQAETVGEASVRAPGPVPVPVSTDIQAPGSAHAQTLCQVPGPAPAVSVCDIGCGNLRFERFLADRFPQASFEIYAVDNCPPLLAGQHLAMARVHFQELDVAGALLPGARSLAQRLEAPTCDLSVCFGFMHHVPGFERRVALLRSLVEQTRPGGLVALSFWRFMADPKRAAAARALQSQALADSGISPADLEAGDYLLGWQGRHGVYRYSHHFSAQEVHALLEGVSDVAVSVDRYRSDGRTGNMNDYAVLCVL